jgi:hypothetical protein
MALYRMLCPPVGFGANPCTVNGRTYTGVLGTMYDIPDFDGKLLEANGWNKIGDLGDGTTAQRLAQSLLPAGQGAPVDGDEFYDQTLGMVVAFDGKSWRRPDTGAVV